MNVRSNQATAAAAPRVAVIGAGGTVAMVGRFAYDWVEYGESGQVRAVEEVVRGLEPLLEGVELEMQSFRTLPSTNITWNDWVDLARLVNQLASRPDIQGIVITHGTASLEDTAWFVDLVVETPMPVVVAGAQRPPNTQGSDAAPNLRAALAVAASSAARGAGVLVVMNSQLFAARDVRKESNFALDAFRSAEFGPIGRVAADGKVTLRRIPIRRDARVSARLAAALDASHVPRVDIVMSYPGADGTAIRAFQQAGAAAIISLGMPPGRCTPAERTALREAVAAGVLVVQSSRALEGGVVRQMYNERDGILSGGDLAANKLRVFLMLALAAGNDASACAELLEEV